MYRFFRRIILLSILALIFLGVGFTAPMATYANTSDDVILSTVSDMPDVYRDQLPSAPWIGHTQSRLSEVSEIFVAPTCEEDGYYEKIVHCGACGRDLRQYKEFPALGHDLKDGVCQREGCDYIDPQSLAPVFVTIVDSENVRVETVDQSSTAIIEDFFTEIDRNSNAVESMTMGLEGVDYSIIRNAEGAVEGSLPEGFQIVGRAMHINGVKDNMSITITSHTILAPSILENDLISEGLALGFFQEPETEELSDEGAEPERDNRNNNNNNDNNRTDETEEETPSPSDTQAAGSTDNASSEQQNEQENAAVTDDIDSSVSDILNVEPSPEPAANIPEYSGNSHTALLLTVDIALVLGLVIGIVALLRLGVLKR